MAQISVTQGTDHLIIPERGESILLDIESGDIVDDSDRASKLIHHLPHGRTVGREVSVNKVTKDRLADLGYRWIMVKQ